MEGKKTTGILLDLIPCSGGRGAAPQPRRVEWKEKASHCHAFICTTCSGWEDTYISVFAEQKKKRCHSSWLLKHSAAPLWTKLNRHYAPLRGLIDPQIWRFVLLDSFSNTWNNNIDDLVVNHVAVSNSSHCALRCRTDLYYDTHSVCLHSSFR